MEEHQVVFTPLLHPIQEGQLILSCPFMPGLGVLLASLVYNVCVALLILEDLSLGKTVSRCNQFLALSIHLTQQLFHVLEPCISGILSENPRMVSYTAPSDLHSILPLIAFSISRMRSIDITPISYNATAIVRRLSPYLTSPRHFAGMPYFPSSSE